MLTLATEAMFLKTQSSFLTMPWIKRLSCIGGAQPLCLPLPAQWSWACPAPLETWGLGSNALSPPLTPVLAPGHRHIQKGQDLG